MADQTEAERIEALAERCEAAAGPDREIDALIAVTLHLVPAWAFDQDTNFPWSWRGDQGDYWDAPTYTASLDAAMTLVPEGLNLSLLVSHRGKSQASLRGVGGRSRYHAAATPALALCAAALRRILTERTDHAK